MPEERPQRGRTIDVVNVCSSCGRQIKCQQVMTLVQLVVQTEDEAGRGIKPLLDDDGAHPSFLACSSRCYGVLAAYIAVRCGER